MQPVRGSLAVMIRPVLIAPVLALLGACASQPVVVPAARGPAAATLPTVVPAGLRSISYSTSPCFGGCPIYAVTVSADGTGLWEGQRYVAATGERSIRVSPDQFAAFARALQPHRPDGERRFNTQADCTQFATDMDGVDVRWTQADGSTDVLSAYYGCDMEANRALFDDLRTAIRQLPVANLIGPAAS